MMDGGQRAPLTSRHPQHSQALENRATFPFSEAQIVSYHCSSMSFWSPRWRGHLSLRSPPITLTVATSPLSTSSWGGCSGSAVPALTGPGRGSWGGVSLCPQEVRSMEVVTAQSPAQTLVLRARPTVSFLEQGPHLLFFTSAWHIVRAQQILVNGR